MVAVTDRITKMRKLLRSTLEQIGAPGTWNHVTDQIGMFTFTGLNPNQVDMMINKHHIYLLKSGRVSMAGVAAKNVKYIAAAIDDVVRNCQ